MTTVAVRGHGELTLPPVLLTNLRAVHGDRFEPWLVGLGPMLAGALGELDARIVPTDLDLSYHLVLFARRAGGEDIVVKCTVPNAEQPPEVAGVEALSAAGIGPRLLWKDLERGVFAMERIVPGERLPTHIPTLEEDAKIIATIGDIAARMSRKTDITRYAGRLVTVRDYTRALDTYDPHSQLWQNHRDEIARARALRDAMLSPPDRRDTFVHGDLHHYNLLVDAMGEPKVIDPKGLVGPAGYDFGVMSYNPMGIQRHPDLAALFRERVTVWSEAVGLPWGEVRDWGYVGAMVSACWESEGGAQGWQDALLSAVTIRELTQPS
ncbi:MAG TPA: aminoglycoside phosphotransferase family protein [Thermomicrobiales bacterium]|nr:aminoglycoside phosphotransferase family protein [Thermomicrobiales bacterium]